MDQRIAQFEPYANSVAALITAVVVALVVEHLVLRRLGRDADRTTLRKHFRRPLTLAFPLIAVLLVWPTLALPDAVADPLRRGILLLLVVACGWLVVAGINVAADVIVARHRTDLADNLDARRVQTQTQVLRRIAVVATVILTGVLILMSIPGAREIGISLFASAGIAGLAIGLAARPTLSNLIAGVQIALTQPIRLDDVVIVEGEWGWIEEIRTTYVVVRIWDLRRLVVPLTYFIEKPFQNWTRTTADILGSVYLQVDHTVPVDEIRAELRRIAEASGMWDGKVCVLHVTDARDRSVELRALVSAADSPKAWELRCLVRERLIAYVRENHPGALPRFRAEIEGLPAAA